jgi:hypothetical protein
VIGLQFPFVFVSLNLSEDVYCSGHSSLAFSFYSR